MKQIKVGGDVFLVFRKIERQREREILPISLVIQVKLIIKNICKFFFSLFFKNKKYICHSHIIILNFWKIKTKYTWYISTDNQSIKHRRHQSFDIAFFLFCFSLKSSKHLLITKNNNPTHFVFYLLIIYMFYNKLFFSYFYIYWNKTKKFKF